MVLSTGGEQEQEPCPAAGHTSPWDGCPSIQGGHPLPSRNMTLPFSLDSNFLPLDPGSILPRNDSLWNAAVSHYAGMTRPGPQSPLGSHAGRGTLPIHRPACGGPQTRRESPDDQFLQREGSPDWEALWGLFQSEETSFDTATGSVHGALGHQPNNSISNGGRPNYTFVPTVTAI